MEWYRHFSPSFAEVLAGSLLPSPAALPVACRKAYGILISFTYLEGSLLLTLRWTELHPGCIH